MLNAKFGFQFFLVLLALGCGFPDGFVEESPFLLTLLEFACQFDSDFVWLAVGIDNFVDDVNHLIKNLLDDRVAQAVALQ